MTKKLTKIKSGRLVKLASIDGGVNAENRLFDMGFVVGERFDVMNNSGFGPITVNVKGSRLAVGHDLAKKLLVEEVI